MAKLSYNAPRGALRIYEITFTWPTGPSLRLRLTAKSRYWAIKRARLVLRSRPGFSFSRAELDAADVCAALDDG